MTAGVAFDEAGVARAGMGVDAADYDGSGRQGLIIGNFSNQMMALYANEGKGLFIDEAPRSALGQASLLTLTFGCFFFDADLDGLPDIFAANGHVADDIERVQPQVTYAQRPHLFRNTRLGPLRRGDRAGGRGARAPDGRPRRGLRRLRRRRRSRRVRDRQQRTGAAAAQRQRRAPATCCACSSPGAARTATPSAPA